MAEMTMQQSQPLVGPRGSPHPSDKGIYGEDAREEELLVQGVFNEGYKGYTLTACLLGSLPVAPLALLCLPCTKRYIDTSFPSFDLRLTDSNLAWSHGDNQCFGLCCWAQRERIVPLEKVTDVTYSQTWLQRMFGVDTLNVRTAAGSMGPEGGGTPDISLTGVVDSKRLRDQILAAKAQKEHLLGNGGGGVGYGGGSRAGGQAMEMARLMEKQAAILERLEARLNGATAPPSVQTMS